jgi:hypothetical protein
VRPDRGQRDDNARSDRDKVRANREELRSRDPEGQRSRKPEDHPDGEPRGGRAADKKSADDHSDRQRIVPPRDKKGAYVPDQGGQGGRPKKADDRPGNQDRDPDKKGKGKKDKDQ